jgi:hypothetical protein
MPSEPASDAVHLVRVWTFSKRTALKPLSWALLAPPCTGAPVTTVDFDFLARDTPGNRKKIRAVAEDLQVIAMQPFFPASNMFRLIGGPVQVDILFAISGSSFNRERASAKEIVVLGRRLLVSSLESIIASRKKAGRAKDKAVIPILEETRKVIKALGRKES